MAFSGLHSLVFSGLRRRHLERVFSGHRCGLLGGLFSGCRAWRMGCSQSWFSGGFLDGLGAG